jgi:hypothetical protein
MPPRPQNCCAPPASDDFPKPGRDHVRHCSEAVGTLSHAPARRDQPQLLHRADHLSTCFGERVRPSPLVPVFF